MGEAIVKTDMYTAKFYNTSINDAEMHNIANMEKEKIDWIVKDARYILYKYRWIRRYYGFKKDIVNSDVFNGKLTIGLPTNIQPCKQYFGWGIAAKTNIKVYWYTEEESKKCIEEFKVLLSISFTPAFALAHEITHALGSSREFTDPLATAAAIRFYSKYAGYITYEILYYGAKEVLTNALISAIQKRNVYNIEVARAIYPINPALVNEVIQKEFAERDQQIIFDVINTNR